ncbi:nucleic acid dioxygenase ALKBH1 [Scaptodrosophila lebanonensis]|uniref:Nucleic acid dioxygenase ALKBH1 n=1 Tax=Drosophila lebanonensis TaxID=7225 RepID=A0A6J2TTM8_DROLE|nr:nucleic acid dioxygenase ALKBH1 [Scaptodrosophila lebanonensis]
MFKEAFKYYKAKWPPPDLNGVIDFEEPSKTNHESTLVELQDNVPGLHLSFPPIGLQPPQSWRCYALKSHPGILVIRNPFTVHGQRYWIARSLRDYPRAPNRINLNENLFASDAIKDWWNALQQCDDKDEARRLKISMRWATLGYHHDWDTKVYSETMHTPFPQDLSNLCQYIATVLGFADFEAQAAIVNFYPIGTTLSGHTDHSEPNQTAPLFSFSFGQTAVFLIGGTTREERPSALYLRSGDVLIMSQQSRLCYHAVPRVMKTQEEPWNNLPADDADEKLMKPERKKLRRDFEDNSNVCDMSLYRLVRDDSFWLPYMHYLNDSRININVRQVLPSGVKQLPLPPS